MDPKNLSDLALTTSSNPVISSITPPSVPVGISQQTITITGSGFEPGMQVLVSLSIDGSNPTSFQPTLLDTSKLQVTLSGSLLQTPVNLFIRLQTQSGVISDQTAYSVGFPNPGLLTPTGVPANQPATLTIQAVDIYASSGRQSGVQIDGVALDPSQVSIQINSSLPDRGTMTVQVPANLLPPGNHAVRLFNPTDNGLVLGGQDVVTANGGGVVLNSITPNTAAVGRDDLSIRVNGTGFDMGVKLQAGGVDLQTNLVPPGLLTATVPRSLLQSVNSLQVTASNPGGSPSNALQFNVQAPAISSVSRLSVPAGQDAFLTIQATNIYVFADNSRSTQAKWDGTLLSANVDLVQGTVTVNVPAGLVTPGAHSLVITNPTDGGSVDSAPVTISTTGGGTGAPTISSLQPTQIPVSATTQVVVSGANLPLSTGSYSVVNSSGQAVAGVQILSVSGGQSSATLQVQVSSTALPGTYSLKAVNSSGQGTSPLQIVAPQHLTITSVMPSAIVIGATNRVTVGGTGLPLTASSYAIVNSSGQVVAGVTIQFVLGNSSSVTLDVTIPANTPQGSYRLRAQTATEVASVAVQIGPAQPPSISSIQPTQIPVGKTTSVAVSGSNLPQALGGYTVRNASNQLVAGVSISGLAGASSANLLITVASTATPGDYRLVAQTAGGQSAVALRIGTSGGLVISGVQPSGIPSGRSSTVKLNGTGLPVSASSYAVTDAAGQVVGGFQIQSASGDSSNVTLLINVAVTVHVGQYQLRAQSGTASATVPLSVISAGTAIPIPTGHVVEVVRLGARHNPATGQNQTHIGVLSRGTAPDGTAVSLLQTFVPGQDAPVLQVQRQGANIHTDFRFVDLAGNGNQYLACATEKSQDEINLNPKVQILEPVQGAIVQAIKLESLKRNSDNTTTVVNPDFGGMGSVLVNSPGTQEVLVVYPQNSFEAFTATILSTNVYFFGYAGGQVTLKIANVMSTGPGDTVERSMLAFGNLSGIRRAVIISKTLVLTFDPVSGTLKARRQVADPFSVDATNVENDVLNPPGNTAKSNPEGRRYGQFRLMSLGAGAGQKIVLAAHSLPKSKTPDDPLRLQSMYTTYPAIADGSTGFLRSLWGPSDAPGNDTRLYRFFQNATKKSDAKTPDQQRLVFLNSALLLGGTPPNGMADLGDGLISVIVSDAPSGKIPATTPMLYVLDAKTGADKLQSAYRGAVALDVLKPLGVPPRVIVWGGLAAGQSYSSGHLQALRFDASQKQLFPLTRTGGGAFEFEQGHQPVLFKLSMLGRVPEDIGVESASIAEVLATPIIGSSGTFLTFRATQPNVVDAYDQNTLERVPANANLNLGTNGVLLGIFNNLSLTTPEPVLPGSAFVTQELDPDGRTVVRFKRVTPDGRLIAGLL
jgi:hypothetical protein